MTRDEIRAAIDARRDGSVPGPRSFNELADAIGVPRGTMRAALSCGPLSPQLAEKCSVVLRLNNTAPDVAIKAEAEIERLTAENASLRAENARLAAAGARLETMHCEGCAPAGAEE